MLKSDFVFTSDSVTEGHPDKLCDQVSDAIVDQFLQQDPYAQVIAECAVATGVVFIATQFHASNLVEIPEVARQVINAVGYVGEDFNAEDCTIMSNLRELPEPTHNQFCEAVFTRGDLDRIVASHPVTVFGFACNQNEAFLPLPLWASHQLARRLDVLRHDAVLPYLLPDGLVQVSIEYRARRPARAHTISVISSQGGDAVPAPAQLTADLHELVIKPVFDALPIAIDGKTDIHINPEGPLLAGGPTVHAGLTGRKGAIDTYGQYSRHGSSALSGKDPSRMERLGAYFARYVAKNIVAAGLAESCEVMLSYSIGQTTPVSVQIETFGTGTVSDKKLMQACQQAFDFRVGAIIDTLKLHTLPAQRKDGLFRKLACYGHMGRTDLEPPWEQADKCAQLKDLTQ